MTKTKTKKLRELIEFGEKIKYYGFHIAGLYPVDDPVHQEYFRYLRAKRREQSG